MVECQRRRQIHFKDQSQSIITAKGTNLSALSSYFVYYLAKNQMEFL